MQSGRPVHNWVIQLVCPNSISDSASGSTGTDKPRDIRYNLGRLTLLHIKRQKVTRLSLYKCTHCFFVKQQQQQAVVLKHNKPRPRVAHRCITRFLGIDEKYTKVVPLPLRTFPESFMQIGPVVFS